MSRLARQARVGILRNTNEPPRPPTRKASLTARWLSLRSSRRPPDRQVLDAALSVAGQPDQGGETASLAAAALRHDESGRLAGIDVAGLMASVEGLGTGKPTRTPYGAQMRPDFPADRPAPSHQTNPRSDDARPAGPTPPVPRIESSPELIDQPLRRRWSGVAPFLGGVILAFVVLVLLPAIMDL